MAFVNLQRLMDLNADKGEEMAQNGLGGPNAEANKAATAAEYSAMWHAGGLNNGAELANRVSRAQQLGQTLSGAGAAAAVPGANGLDAALMGQSRAGQAYQQRTKNLQGLMSGANAAYDARQRQTAANRQFAGMTQDADAAYAARQAAADAKIKAATKGYINAQNRWQAGNYNPKTPDEYAAYSDYIQRGGR